MNRKTTEDATAAFAKIQELADGEGIVIFSASEAQALKEVATLWSQIKATASLGASIGSILKWVVMFFAAWGAFKLGFLDWIKEGLDK